MKQLNNVRKMSIDEIYDLFNYFPEIQDKGFVDYLITALSLLDENTIDIIADRVIFISAEKYTRGIFVNHLSKRYKNKDIVFLNISRYKNKKIIISIILHEIAHAYYRHKSYQYDFGDSELYEKQENEADELAKKWYPEYIKLPKKIFYI